MSVWGRPGGRAWVDWNRAAAPHRKAAYTTSGEWLPWCPRFRVENVAGPNQKLH